MPIPAVLAGIGALAAAHPYITLAGVQAGGGLIANLLGKSREDEQRKAQEKAIKTQNLIQALSGGRIGYNPQVQAPLPGWGERIAGGVSQAAGLASFGLQASQADAVRLAQLAGQKLQNKAMQEALDRAQGVAAAQALPMPKPAIEPKTIMSVPQRQGAGSAMTPRGSRFGNVPPTPSTTYAPPADLSTAGQAGFLQALRERQTADNDQSYTNEYRQVQLAAARQGLQLNNMKLLQALTPVTQRPGLDADTVMSLVTATGTLTPDLTREEFFNLASMQAIQQDSGPFGVSEQESLLGTYQAAAQTRLERLDENLITRVDALRAAVKTDKTVSEGPEYSRALGLIIEGLEVENGLGDIQALKMIGRMQDPGGIIKAEEYSTLAGAVSALEKYEIFLKRYMKGDQLTAEGRLRVLELAEKNYLQRWSDINAILDAQVTGFINQPGFEKYEKMFNLTVSPYRLREVPKDKVAALKEKFRPLIMFNSDGEVFTQQQNRVRNLLERTSGRE